MRKKSSVHKTSVARVSYFLYRTARPLNTNGTDFQSEDTVFGVRSMLRSGYPIGLEIS
jgi:hypothetical protein